MQGAWWKRRNAHMKPQPVILPRVELKPSVPKHERDAQVVRRHPVQLRPSFVRLLRQPPPQRSIA